MNRLGIRAESDNDIRSAVSEIKEISKLDRLEIEGMFTHFPRSDESTADGDAFTREQFRLFSAVDTELKKQGIYISFRHVCNSAGAVRFPEFSLDGVRVGILLYGGGESFSELPLSPVMSFETAVSHVHTVKRGESVGYGGTFTAERDMKLITMPVGYADGFIRDLKDCQVTLFTRDKKPHRVSLVGRICMDQCMADATGTDAAPGDRVVLFGGNRDELSDLARHAGTIDYEILCLVSARVPRIDKSTHTRVLFIGSFNFYNNYTLRRWVKIPCPNIFCR
jgi:alanine racemase